MADGIVPMADDFLWPLQQESHISATNGTGTNNFDKEVWQLGDVLRGRRGDRDTYPGGQHRATGRSICMHENGTTELQTLEM